MPKIKKASAKKTGLTNSPKQSLKQKLLILLGLTLVLSGLFLLNKFAQIRFPKVNTSFNAAKTSERVGTNVFGPIKISKDLMRNANGTQEPERIVIPSSNIDINITESEVKDGYWETSESTASHGIGSANPGQAGNSVVFAHARPGLFYNLKDVRRDDIIYVLTQKRWYAYKVSEITDVFPNQVEVISPTKDERLTLYTCTGYSDEKRLIVVAKPIKI